MTKGNPALTSPSANHGASTDFYNSTTLKLYDFAILGLSNRFAWKCPTPLLLENYRQHEGQHHLDIGPGTGFYLEDTSADSVTLLDLNQVTLGTSRARIERNNPELPVDTLSQSFFDDLNGTWGSIGVNFVLHCINSDNKWGRLADLGDNLEPGGTLFGSTILLDQGTANVGAKTLCSLYNRVGAFGNANDHEQQLSDALSSFTSHSVERHGQVLIFSATV